MATQLNTKSTVVALAEKLIAGTSKHLANMTQITLAGSSFTPSQITARLQELVTLRNDVDAAKASTKARLAVEEANMPALRVLMDALVTFVKAAHGTEPDVLADFGLHPKARTPLTVEAKTAAVAKRNATRAARHTTGPKQKKSVKGAVTGIVVTPVTAKETVATAAPTGPSAPATSTGTTTGSTPHTT